MEVTIKKKIQTQKSPFTYETELYNSQNDVRLLFFGRNPTQNNTTAVVNYLQENVLNGCGDRKNVTLLIHEPIEPELIDFCIHYHKCFFLNSALIDAATNYENTSLKNVGKNCLFEAAVLYSFAIHEPQFDVKTLNAVKLCSKKIEFYLLSGIYQYGLNAINKCCTQAYGENFKSVIKDIQMNFIVHKRICNDKIEKATSIKRCQNHSIQSLFLKKEFADLVKERLFDDLRWDIFKAKVLRCISQIPSHSTVVVFDPSVREKHGELEILLRSVEGFEIRPVTLNSDN